MNKFYAAFRRYQLQDTILNCKNMRNQRKQNCYKGALQRPTELYKELWISKKEKRKFKVKIQVLPKISPNSRSRFLTPKLSLLGLGEIWKLKLVFWTCLLVWWQKLAKLSSIIIVVLGSPLQTHLKWICSENPRSIKSLGKLKGQCCCR